MSRAERRRSEREKRKREKKEAIHRKQRERRSSKKEEVVDPQTIPWDEDSPKCPNCGADWKDEGEIYSCHDCGRFAMKSDLSVEDCERCGRPFLWESLETWSGTDYEDHSLCSECLNQVMIHGDMECLKKV